MCLQALQNAVQHRLLDRLDDLRRSVDTSRLGAGSEFERAGDLLEVSELLLEGDQQQGELLRLQEGVLQVVGQLVGAEGNQLLLLGGNSVNGLS